jgi:SAM-dependent methyltransferase
MRCRICGRHTEKLFELRNSLKTQAVCPTAEEARLVPMITLEVYRCSTCDFFQIPKTEFAHYEDPDYFLTTQISDTQRQYQQWLVGFLGEYLSSPIAEIGPGDGYFGAYLSEKHSYTAFEPAKKSYEQCLEKGLNVVNGYFARGSGTWKTIVSRQVLEHVDDLDTFISEISEALADDGFVVTEVPNIGKGRLLNRLVDFCPEHLNYFTLSSLGLCFAARGFEILRLDKTYNDEYIVAVARKRPQFHLDRWAVISGLGERVFWGAGSRGIGLCHLLGVVPKYFVDSDPHKWGKYIPSLGVEIRRPETIFEEDVNSIVVTSFFYLDEIVCSLRQRGFAGDIYGIDERYELIKVG